MEDNEDNAVPAVPAQQAGPTETGTRRRRRPLVLVLALIAVVVYGLDQITKWQAEQHLTPGQPVEFLDGLLHLRLLYNSGAAFSIATGLTWLLTVLAVVVVVVIVRVATRLGSRGWAVALGLLLGGALGNLTDRLARQPGFGQGHVVDFLEFGFVDFPVFNIADSAITLAAVCVVLLGLRGIGVDGVRERSAVNVPDGGDG
ncbi:MAG TPA: signal peptidase II [Actinomycetales bacterium]|nr:signal peptidase II [Actinomycetales bacterium]